MTAGVRRSSIIFGAAVVGSNLGQLAWLVAGARALPGERFGTVLTAQALYGVLQIILDNGPAFHGARAAAQETLDADSREEVVRARVALSIPCALAGVGISGIGGLELLTGFAPFALALTLFSVLNVWEPYGKGNVLPYATYLLLRSTILGGVIGVFAFLSTSAPAVTAGLCELAAIMVTGVLYTAWSALPRVSIVRRATWRAIYELGFPALITQYNLAIAVILLGVTGRAAAAAACAVTFRLLTGLQGVNGAAAAAVFPGLARNRPLASDERASSYAAVGILALSWFAFLGTAIAAPLFVRGLLDSSSGEAQTAMVIGLAGSGAAGLVMHRSFALIARGKEAQLLRAAVIGAAVVTTTALLATLLVDRHRAVAAVAGYVGGQVVTLALITRIRDRVSGPRPSELGLYAVAMGVMPLLGVTLALEGGSRPLLASAAAGLGGLVACVWAIRWAGRRRSVH